MKYLIKSSVGNVIPDREGVCSIFALTIEDGKGWFILGDNVNFPFHLCMDEVLLEGDVAAVIHKNVKSADFSDILLPAYRITFDAGSYVRNYERFYFTGGEDFIVFYDEEMNKDKLNLMNYIQKLKENWLNHR